MSLQLEVVVGALAAALVAITVVVYRAAGPSLRWHRRLTLVAAAACAAGVGLLALGAQAAGGAGLALAGEAFFCSVAFIAAPPDDGEDDDDDDGGGGEPPAPDDDPDAEWRRFTAELADWAAREPVG